MNKIGAFVLAVVILAIGFILIPVATILTIVIVGAGPLYGPVFAILSLGIICIAGALFGALSRAASPQDPGRRFNILAGWIAAFVFLGGWAVIVHQFMTEPTMW